MTRSPSGMRARGWTTRDVSMDLDKVKRGAGDRTVHALMEPCPGDVFRYRDRQRWIVVTGVTCSTVSLLFFPKRYIEGPWDRDEATTTTRDAFVDAYFHSNTQAVDPSNTLNSLIILVSRGFPVNSDWVCAGCPVDDARRKDHPQRWRTFWQRAVGRRG